MINFNDQFKSVMKQAQNKFLNYQLLQADNLVSKNNYQLAFFILEQIPQTSDAYTEAQNKLVEYRNAFAVNLLQEAVNKYNNGCFTEALASLKRIPEKTQVHPQAQEKIRDCEKAIRKQQKEQEERLIEQAANHILKKDFEKAITILKRIPKTSELYIDVQQKIVKCEEGIKQQNLAKQREQEERLIELSANYAASHDFKKAITTLEGIPKTSERFAKVQQKIIEYRDSFAISLIQEGIIKYNNGHFAEAITAYKLVPEGTLAYQQAQDKIKECEEAIRQQLIAQQREQERLLREKKELIASFKNLVPINYKGKLVAAALVNNLTYIVDSIEMKDYIADALHNKTKADGEFIIFRLLVRNDDKKSHTIFLSGINLVDAESREFSESSSGNTALMMSGDETAKFMATEVQPGLQKKISIVFDIPREAGDLKLRIPNGLFGKPAILPLSLAL